MTAQTQLNFSITESAIKRAVDHADAIHEGWSEKAYEFFVDYAKINSRFKTEDVRAASVGVVPEPPHRRAWGGIARKAAHAGIIHNHNNETGKVKNIKAHNCLVQIWKSTIVKNQKP